MSFGEASKFEQFGQMRGNERPRDRATRGSHEKVNTPPRASPKVVLQNQNWAEFPQRLRGYAEGGRASRVFELHQREFEVPHPF